MTTQPRKDVAGHGALDGRCSQLLDLNVAQIMKEVCGGSNETVLQAEHALCNKWAKRCTKACP